MPEKRALPEDVGSKSLTSARAREPATAGPAARRESLHVVLKTALPLASDNLGYVRLLVLLIEEDTALRRANESSGAVLRHAEYLVDRAGRRIDSTSESKADALEHLEIVHDDTICALDPELNRLEPEVSRT